MSDGGSIQVLVPTPLRRYTNGEARVRANGATVGEVFAALDQQYPGIKERICESDGQIRRFVNVFINGENARELDGIETALKPGDEVGIIPAMAGGASA